jgi:peroxin-10
MRGDPYDDSRWAKIKGKVISFLETPLGQSLPEIHLVFFMFGGKFYEFARRLAGLGYVRNDTWFCGQ